MICDECETVAHCTKHGCIPKHPDYKDAIEVSVIFHEGQRMFAVPKQPAQQEPWGFHIQFNNGKDATFKGLDYLAECEAHLEAGETITMLYIKENT